jgi:hypothetical protein
VSIARERGDETIKSMDFDNRSEVVTNLVVVMVVIVVVVVMVLLLVVVLVVVMVVDLGVVIVAPP